MKYIKHDTFWMRVYKKKMCEAIITPTTKVDRFECCTVIQRKEHNKIEQ